MPLEAPNLDTRTYDELVSAARLRIPRYTPEWTDFNDSDPGMTLLQLFAWLTELMLHEMNRIPERNYIKFLQLLNLELRPAQPATAYLTFAPDLNSVDFAVAVPPGTQVAAQSPETGEQIIFETEEGLDLIRTPLVAVRVFDGASYSDRGLQNAIAGESFRPLGWVPQPGSALYLGFARPKQAVRVFPDRIRLRVFSAQPRDADRAQRCAGATLPPPAPVTLVWEQFTGLGRWRTLQTYKEESVCLTRQGAIELEGPRGSVASEQAEYADGPLHWLRCRLVEGSYPPGQEPEIDAVRANVAAAKSLVTVSDELVAVSSGRPDQSFTLANRPVAPRSLRLELLLPNGEVEDTWEPVDDLLGSAKDAYHYTLNANRGAIGFGDGAHGAIPVAGAEVVARVYRYGGGAASNVGAGLINQPLANLRGVESVTNERPAEGGRDEQALEELKRAAPARIRCRDRAVTAADFVALAAEAGGVARATALAQRMREHPEIAVPGAVTVIIVPDSDQMPPVPSPDLCASVCEHLNPHRLLTTELYVAGPRYLKISVEAKIEARPYAAFAQVREQVEAQLNAYLRPLRPRSAGQRRAAQGEGGWEWPFGQDLNPRNLYREILNVGDVVSVRQLRLFVDGHPWDQLDKPVVLEPDQLIYGADHGIAVVPAVDR